MNKYHINVFWSDEDAAWVADVPDLKTCSAFGDTPERALAEVRTAMSAWLAVARAEGHPIPAPAFRPAIYIGATVEGTRKAPQPRHLAKADVGSVGKFVIKRGPSGRWMFKLKTGNGVTVVTEEVFANKKDAKKAITSVRKAVAVTADLTPQMRASPAKLVLRHG